MNNGILKKLSAFTTDPKGGNPAGVWIGEKFPVDSSMQEIAADIGYSETAFIVPSTGKTRSIRYFSPEKEVPFCGHATIASGVALGELDGMGTYSLQCAAGTVAVNVSKLEGQVRAALTSVEPAQKSIDDHLLDRTLECLYWNGRELDPSLPPVIAYAGAWHIVIATKTLERLNSLDYAYEPLKELMLANDITTVNLIWRESVTRFHSRNPFPVGGVVEDPATGAAAAALGGYLRDSGLLVSPAEFEIWQGDTMGRPSRIYVSVPESGGITVSGAAVPIS